MNRLMQALTALNTYMHRLGTPREHSMRMRPPLQLLEFDLEPADRLPEASARHDWPTFASGDQPAVQLLLAACNGDWEAFGQQAAEYPHELGNWRYLLVCAAEQGDTAAFCWLHDLHAAHAPRADIGQPADYRAVAEKSGNAELVEVIDQMQNALRERQMMLAIERALAA